MSKSGVKKKVLTGGMFYSVCYVHKGETKKEEKKMEDKLSRHMTRKWDEFERGKEAEQYATNW